MGKIMLPPTETIYPLLLKRSEEMTRKITGDTMTLYDLTSQQLSFLNSLGEQDIDAIAEAALAELDNATGEKLDGYLAVRATKEMHAAQARKESEEWKVKAVRLEAEIAKLDAALRLHLERTGQDRTRTAKGRTIALQLNGGHVPLEFETVADPSSESLEYVRVRTAYEWDKEKIRKTLESGQELPFVKLGQRGRRLVIK